MLIKCEYCDGMIEDTLEKCPNCGGVNNNVARAAKKIPTTIEELKAFCEAKKLDLERMHFHIGEDYKEPKAFGIFKGGDGNFVVYKNKADGSRAIRYRGKDEKYAVNELYQKLKVEFIEAREWGNARRANSAPSRGTPTPEKKKGISPALLIFIAVVLLYLFLAANSPSKGYYNYGGDTYRYSGSSWYVWNIGSEMWEELSGVDSELSDNYKEYQVDDHEVNDEYVNNWDDDWDDDDWGSSSDWDDDDYDYFDSDFGSDWDSDW